MGKKKLGTDQFAELGAAVLRSLPRDMEPELAQFWILHQDLLATTLDGALIARQPAKPTELELPTEMTVGGRTYEILSFLREGEERVHGHTMVARAEKLGAYLGKEDCEFILAHQDEIPAALRGKIVFVFPDMRYPVGRECVAYLRWRGDRWYQYWGWLDVGWDDGARVLRRKAA
ncbi:MAG: hypothetical protein WC445_02390 [Patescibacteria group bacterium]